MLLNISKNLYIGKNLASAFTFSSLVFLITFNLFISTACTDGIKATSATKRNALTDKATTDSTIEKLALLEKQVIELVMTWSGSDTDKTKANEYISAANTLTTTIGGDSSLSTNERVQYLQRVSVLKTLVETKITQNTGGTSPTDIEELKKQIYGTTPSSLDKPSQANRNSAFSTTGTITFSWSAVNDALSYNVKIGTTPGTGNLFSGNVGNVLFKSLEGVASGTTAYATVQAVNGTVTSEYSDPSLAIYVDTAAPTVPTNLILSKINGGASVSTSNSSTFYLRWDIPVDSASGLKDYTISLYAQPNCTGSSIDTVGFTNNSTIVNIGTDNTTYSFKVKAYDQAGNFSTSTCSSSLTVDLTSPPALLTFSGATGTANGEVALTIDFPLALGDLERVVIRSLAGATPPADCNSGTAIKTFTNFTNTIYNHQTNAPDSPFSYRACVYDAAGNLTSTNTAANVISNVYVHTIFATNNTYNGNLGGLVGGDNLCTIAASSAGLTGKWRVVLADSTTNARDRIVIKGIIKNRRDEVIANNKLEFWGGTLQHAIRYTETNSTTAQTSAWATANSAGYTSGTANVAHCLDWTNTTGSSGYLGDATTVGSGWTNNGSLPGCTSLYRLYCISQFEGYDLAGFSAATGTGANGDVDLTINFPADTSGFQTVTIRRLEGGAPPNSSCSSNGTLIKTFDTSTGFADTTFTDTTPNPGRLYSYRACVFDSVGDIMSTSVISKIIAKGHRHIIFATSSVFQGDFGGLAGGDGICQTHANAASISGTFRALISTSAVSAFSRVPIAGPVYTVANGLVAGNQAELWDGNIGTVILNEIGTNALDRWTGSTSAGVKSSTKTCNDWTSNSNGVVAIVGTSFTNGGWFSVGGDVACDEQKALHCISE